MALRDDPSDGEPRDGLRDDPLDPQVRSATLEDEAGDEYVVDQQNAGPEAEKGGGEWPDPGADPVPPAPGSAE